MQIGRMICMSVELEQGYSEVGMDEGVYVGTMGCSKGFVFQKEEFEFYAFRHR